MIQLQPLLDLQNADGGWSYGSGASWTEPTCYALLSLSAAGAGATEPARRAARWVSNRQRSDGGWAPRDGIAQSTCVTSLPLLLPAGLVPPSGIDRAVAWLLSQNGRESGLIHRLRMRLLGVEVEDQPFDGWPWYPDTAAWVAPTALTVLALRKSGRGGERHVKKRIEEGGRYLVARRCRDGGWNHGSTKALGYDSDSYPETTGMALLALHDSTAPEVVVAEALAERHLASCRSCEGSSWLRLALLSRGRRPSGEAVPNHARTLEVAMAILAEAAENGRNMFLEGT